MMIQRQVRGARGQIARTHLMSGLTKTCFFPGFRFKISFSSLGITFIGCCKFFLLPWEVYWLSCKIFLLPLDQLLQNLYSKFGLSVAVNCFSLGIRFISCCKFLLRILFSRQDLLISSCKFFLVSWDQIHQLLQILFTIFVLGLSIASCCKFFFLGIRFIGCCSNPARAKAAQERAFRAYF